MFMVQQQQQQAQGHVGKAMLQWEEICSRLLWPPPLSLQRLSPPSLVSIQEGFSFFIFFFVHRLQWESNSCYGDRVKSCM